MHPVWVECKERRAAERTVSNRRAALRYLFLQTGTAATPSVQAFELNGEPAACVPSPVILQGAHVSVSSALVTLNGQSLSLFLCCSGMEFTQTYPGPPQPPCLCCFPCLRWIRCPRNNFLSHRAVSPAAKRPAAGALGRNVFYDTRPRKVEVGMVFSVE